MTIACDDAIFVIHQPSAFGVHTQIAESLVFLTWCGLIVSICQLSRHHTWGVAQAVLVIHPVQPHFGLYFVKAQARFQTRCVRFTVGITGHFHAVIGAQAVVIHHMIHIAVTVLRFQFGQPRREVATRDFHIPRIAVKFNPVHRAVSIRCMTTAAVVTRLNQGFFIGGDAHLYILTIARIGGMHFFTIAICVVVRFVIDQIQACIAVFPARSQTAIHIETPRAARSQAAVKAQTRLSEFRRIAHKLYRAGNQSRTLRDRLWAFGNDDVIVVLRINVRRRWIHTSATTTKQVVIVGGDRQTRPTQATEQRITVNPAFADHGHIRYSFEQRRAIRHG